MPRVRPLLLLSLILSLPLPGLAWEAPPRGSELRVDLVDALRSHAKWLLGAPVIVVVEDMRVSVDAAVASLRRVHPGEREITRDWMSVRESWGNPFDRDGVHMQALSQRSGRTRVAVQHAIGATDVRWAHPDDCPTWEAVIPESC